MLTTSIVVLTCCSAEDPYSEYGDYGYEGMPNGGFAGNGSSSAVSGELTTFDVSLDLTTAEPEEAAEEYFPDEEDLLENNEFTKEVTIDLSNPVSKTENGVEVTVRDGHVKVNHGLEKKICYVVSGTTSNGSLTVMGDKKYAVRLCGANITNPDSAALNLLSSKRAYVILADGTTNTLADGTGGSQKGALYCKGKLLFNGNGSLSVTGNSNNGIHSADYIVFRKGSNVYVKSTANHGIKANDGVFINGGILNVEVSAAGAKGINSECDVIVNGGRTTVITTGNGTWDSDDMEAKGAAAVKADSVFTMNAGVVMLKSKGSGGKGLRAGWEGYINGGALRIVTEGGLYYSNGTQESNNYTDNTDRIADAYTSSPKGIKVGTKGTHGVLCITGGDVMVRTKGNNGEGIESKGTLEISGGTVQVSAYDDGINSSGDLTVSGGTVVAVGTANDGIDANGNMYLKGGTLIAFGAGGAETGIDIGENYRLYITGGNIFGIGGRVDASLGSTSQGVATTTGSVQGNGTVTVASGQTTVATFTMPPYSYSSGTIMVSAPGMKSGSSYTLNLGSTSQSIKASSVLSSMGGRPGGW